MVNNAAIEQLKHFDLEWFIKFISKKYRPSPQKRLQRYDYFTVNQKVFWIYF